MAKKDTKKKEQPKPPAIKYNDTEKFDALDRLMRDNRGIRGPM